MSALPSRDVLSFTGNGVVQEVDAGGWRLNAGSWSWIALSASFGQFPAELTEVSPPKLREARVVLAERSGRAGT